MLKPKTTHLDTIMLRLLSLVMVVAVAHGLAPPCARTERTIFSVKDGRTDGLRFEQLEHCVILDYPHCYRLRPVKRLAHHMFGLYVLPEVMHSRDGTSRSGHVELVEGRECNCLRFMIQWALDRNCYLMDDLSGTDIYAACVGYGRLEPRSDLRLGSDAYFTHPLGWRRGYDHSVFLTVLEVLKVLSRTLAPDVSRKIVQRCLDRPSRPRFQRHLSSFSFRAERVWNFRQEPYCCVDDTMMHAIRCTTIRRDATSFNLLYLLT